jgi:hypothetical protein
MSLQHLSTNIKGIYTVSTIYRQSSAMMDPAPWYYETFVWYEDDNKKFQYFDETDSSKNGTKHHFEVVQRYLDILEAHEIIC